MQRTNCFDAFFRSCWAQAFVAMQFQKLMLCVLVLLAVASCNAKPMPAARVPACSRLNQEPCAAAKSTARLRDVSSLFCPAGLLQVSIALALHLHLHRDLRRFVAACGSYHWTPKVQWPLAFENGSHVSNIWCRPRMLQS